MSKRGKRSKQAISRRKIKTELKTFILNTSYRDFKIGETVCTVTREQIEYHGKITFGPEFDSHEESMLYPFYESVRDGSVLTDSYGRGCFQ